MDPFVKVTGVVAPLDRVNIDTDQIIPAVFLKRIERSGFEDCLFFSWRFNEDGSAKSDFVLKPAGVPECQRLGGGSQFRVRFLARTCSPGLCATMEFAA